MATVRYILCQNRSLPTLPTNKFIVKSKDSRKFPDRIKLHITLAEDPVAVPVRGGGTGAPLLVLQEEETWYGMLPRQINGICKVPNFSSVSRTGGGTFYRDTACILWRQLLYHSGGGTSYKDTACILQWQLLHQVVVTLHQYQGLTIQH